MMKTVFRTALTFTIACLALLAVTAASPAPDRLTPLAEAAGSAGLVESTPATSTCLAAQSAGATYDCAEGCKIAAEIARDEGDPPLQVLNRLIACLDECPS
jgi:hypothetical protein